MAQKKRSDWQNISLVTTQRDELFAIGRLIAEGLEPQFLQDPKRPVTISICGSFQSGKSIIAEEARNGLTPPQTQRALYTGEGIEIFKGVNNIETIYLDAARNPATVEKLSDLRTAGGIDLIQNAEMEQRKTADIEVWVESGKWIVGGYRSHMSSSPLAETYNRFSFIPGDVWTRYVEIDVRNPDLAQSKPWQSALSRIAGLHNVFAEAATKRRPDTSPGIHKDTKVICAPSLFTRAVLLWRRKYGSP